MWSELSMREKREMMRAMADNMSGDALIGYGVGEMLYYEIPFVANTLSKANKYKRLQKTYAGVPHTYVKGTSSFMDESFPKEHNMHTVWTSDDVDYARSGTWSKYDNNSVFDVYYDPEELSILEAPPVPEDQMVYWQGLPYKLENGKITYADNTRIERSGVGIPKNKELAFNGKDSYGNYKPEVLGKYIEKDNEFARVRPYNVNGWDVISGNIKTDDVVKYSVSQGYDATKLHRVYDGGVYLGEYFDYPINELIFNPGANKYVLQHGKSHSPLPRREGARGTVRRLGLLQPHACARQVRDSLIHRLARYIRRARYATFI